MNIKYDDGLGNVRIINDDPDCLQQIMQQGPKGNILVTCVKRKDPDVPPVCDCSPLQRIDVDIQFNYDNPGHSYTTQDMSGTQAYVMSFKTGDGNDHINMLMAQEYGGEVVTKYMRISESPCDFSVPPGYNQSGSTTKLLFSVGADVGVQVLKPNTRYYVNLKNEDVVNFPGVSSCKGGPCGFVLTFYR